MARDWTQEEFGLTDRTPVLDIEALKRENKELEARLKKTQELELGLRKENEQLKELLKECRDTMNKAGYLFAKIDDVKKAKRLLKQIDEELEK